MNDVIVEVDLYNITITGEVAKTLNCAATDSDRLPCIVAKASAKRSTRKPESCITGREQESRHAHCSGMP